MLKMIERIQQAILSYGVVDGESLPENSASDGVMTKTQQLLKNMEKRKVLVRVQQHIEDHDGADKITLKLAEQISDFNKRWSQTDSRGVDFLDSHRADDTVKAVIGKTKPAYVSPYSQRNLKRPDSRPGSPDPIPARERQTVPIDSPRQSPGRKKNSATKIDKRSESPEIIELETPSVSAHNRERIMDTFSKIKTSPKGSPRLVACEEWSETSSLPDEIFLSRQESPKPSTSKASPRSPLH
jgi:hypothetical protein